ncbi:MAG: rRNA maturation RNase YbeY [Candidatus Cloacimonas sp.]|nr:rRNA maturation RNase YbeY [Candidatus Cloacimonadota bacterium]
MNTQRISIKNNTNQYVDIRLVQQICELILQIESESQNEAAELGVCFVTDEEIRKLNKQYFGRDKITDILSFASEFEEVNYLGELIINLDLVSRLEQKAIYQELVALLVHGVLHLLGYDHINTKEGEIMRSKEKVITNKILEVLDHNGK